MSKWKLFLPELEKWICIPYYRYIFHIILQRSEKCKSIILCIFIPSEFRYVILGSVLRVWLEYLVGFLLLLLFIFSKALKFVNFINVAHHSSLFPGQLSQDLHLPRSSELVVCRGKKISVMKSTRGKKVITSSWLYAIAKLILNWEA